MVFPAHALGAWSSATKEFRCEKFIEKSLLILPSNLIHFSPCTNPCNFAIMQINSHVDMMHLCKYTCLHSMSMPFLVYRIFLIFLSCSKVALDTLGNVGSEKTYLRK